MKAALTSIRKELAGIFPKAEIDSLVFLIFEKMKGYSRTQFLLSTEEILSEDERIELEKMVTRLKNHEPIQYILGQTEFYGLPFYSLPGVLIPRPETEELVQWIIQENSLLQPCILDMGTGTGCIAISLQKNIEHATTLACDISPLCIETAQRNAKLNGIEISVFEYDILNNTPNITFPHLDVIVSNPPYVRESEKLLMERNVLEHEPELALFVADEKPLIFYERIADFAHLHLKSQGRLYFEINEAFGEQCVEMLQAKGFSDIIIRKDIHGKDRMIRSVVGRS
ncbi:MAG TPA: peptide chain release factor N(5)-glutamine methyltransferase [Prolixibacteraceae bacterium]|jgi:release factor glutamine methyltransferase|nr:peptide chain release factor N(5)-glutamine methyltransferase [Prolixibacteraceae bacterium]